MRPARTAASCALALAVSIPVATARHHAVARAQSPEQTTARIDELARIEGWMRSDPRAARAELLRVTESAAGGERERDERLEALRHEIGELESALARSTSAAPATAPPDAAAAVIAASVPKTLPAPPRASASRAAAVGAISAGPHASADPLRQALALYRADRLERALEIFESLGDEPRALGWRGRTLERLGRASDAASIYERLIELPNAGPAADDARADLEFVRWRLKFEAKRAALVPAQGARSREE